MAEIPDEEVTRPKVPVHVLVQEARDLLAWCAPDREALERTGLDWGLVESLAVRAEAAGWAQSLWIEYRESQKTAREAAKASREEARALLSELRNAMRFAYRGDSERLAVVRSAAGGSDASLVQDLNTLAVLGRENLDPLVAVGFDAANLERAASLSDTVAGRIAEATVERQAGGWEIKAKRDRACTYLKQAVDTIRRHGRFVFQNDKHRARGYASRYQRKQSRIKDTALE
jgi:hypothetical protein